MTQDVKVAGEEIEMGGHKLIMPPLPLLRMNEIKALLKGNSGDNEEFIPTLVQAVAWCLKRNYQDAYGPEFVAENLDTANYQDVLAKFMKVNKFTAQEPGQGEAQGMPTT